MISSRLFDVLGANVIGVTVCAAPPATRVPAFTTFTSEYIECGSGTNPNPSRKSSYERSRLRWGSAQCRATSELETHVPPSGST